MQRSNKTSVNCTVNYENVAVVICWLVCFSFLFTGLHGMQTRSSYENSVRVSVRLSNSDKTEYKSAV